MDGKETDSHEGRIRALVGRYIEKCHAYTAPYEREKIKEDWLNKVKNTESLLPDFYRRAGNPQGKRVLEIGFGSGLQAVVFAKAGAEMHGLEVNQVLYDIAKENAAAYGITADFQMYDGVHIPYPDNSFDFIYSLSVLEHVSDLPGLMKEASRVLKPGGRFYVSFPNRFALKETHTGVWFVSYLPRFLARPLLKLATGSDAMDALNLHFLSFFSFKRRARDAHFSILFETDSKGFFKRMVKQLLAALGIHYSALLSTVMLVLEKRPL